MESSQDKLHDELVFEDSENYSGSQSSDGLSEDTTDGAGNNGQSSRPMRHKQRSFVGSSLTRTLRRLRRLLWLVLLAIMALSTAGMYWFSVHQESSMFVTEFKGHGRKLLDSFQSDAHHKLESLDSLSRLCTLHALEHTETWPMVTIPHSAFRLHGYLSIVGAAVIALQPIVPSHLRTQWEEYTQRQQSWIDDAIKDNELLGSGDASQDKHEHDSEEHERRLKRTSNTTSSTANMSDTTALKGVNTSNVTSYRDSASDSNNISPFIHGKQGRDTGDGPYVVWWQYAPVTSTSRSIFNYNRLTEAEFQAETETVIQHQSAGMSHTYTHAHASSSAPADSKFDDALHSILESHDNDDIEPFMHVHYPVFEYMDRNSQTVAILSATIFWRNYFVNALPVGVNGVICVVENNNGQTFSYRIDGPVATFLGLQDFHEAKYGHLEMKGSFTDANANEEPSGARSGVPFDEEYMSYSVRLYPSATLEKSYRTTTPLFVALVMVLMFLLPALLFQLYDHFVARRQNAIMIQATKTDDIVSSLFPETVRSRILGGGDNDQSVHGGLPKGRIGSGHSVMSSHSNCSGTVDKSSVIADFYPESTVLFTDIKGFTAWCSEREPSQVFVLLETLYNAYDIIATKRKVFKVETIGDCYMAVTGLPEPQADHAVIMCKFARECLVKMHKLLSVLDVTLGPGTSNLSMRYGIHSGPVTAGVIRSQNARFQLFGDTVNTAARMESNGEAGRIHISQETALQLAAHGKGHWFVPRQDKIIAKGKGELQTFWLKTADDDHSSSGASVMSTLHNDPVVSRDGSQKRSSEIEGLTIGVLDDTASRLVDWIVDALSGYLEQISAHRLAHKQAPTGLAPVVQSFGFNVFEELENTPLPTFDDRFTQKIDSDAVTLNSRVIDELYAYVHNIIAMYNDNPFHNFEHAAHVSMSVIKRLGRIDIPKSIEPGDPRILFADPLTRFSCVFAAVIHDVGHNGVPNSQLLSERDKFAVHYQGRSVAEQVAIEVGWRLLMRPEYDNLRGAIYSNEEELGRFRYLLTTSIIATDIADPGLRHGRDNKWSLAFPDQPNGMSLLAQGSLKAGIAIEVLMQASDLAHTMQHWDVYRKWNEKYFAERMIAFHDGRADSDPSATWYENELDFFDQCVIPLAKKTKECGVFGVSSEECLSYATKNREAWVTSGREINSEMIAANVCFRVKC